MTGNLVRVTNRTSLEALIRGNADKRRIAPNNTFNHILLQTDEWRNYSWPNNTGTGFAIEAKDKPFGKTIEKEFTYGDERKILIYHVRKEDIGASDLMNLFEHQFQDGESTIQLIDAKTEKQILTVEGLREADEIILKVVGDIRNFKLTDRNGGEFETADTKIWATDSSAVGLLGRGYGDLLYHYRLGISLDRGGVDAGDFLDVRCGVLFEERSAKRQPPLKKTDRSR